MAARLRWLAQPRFQCCKFSVSRLSHDGPRSRGHSPHGPAWATILGYFSRTVANLIGSTGRYGRVAITCGGTPLAVRMERISSSASAAACALAVLDGTYALADRDRVTVADIPRIVGHDRAIGVAARERGGDAEKGQRAHCARAAALTGGRNSAH